MEHLFKLKRKGTVTGYKKTVNGLIFIKSVTTNHWGCLTAQTNFGDFVEYRFAIDEDVIDELYVDSIHPFVTKDKNGKDVFADDKVSFLLYRCRDKEDGIIKWQQKSHRFAFYFDSGKAGPWGFTNKDIIEVIEDKENESDDGS